MKRRSSADPKAGGNHEYGPRHGKHTRNPGWIPGEHWFCCQRCGLDHYAKDGRREWTGAIVCLSCWEPRHPQDFVRSTPERITPGDGLFTCGINLGEGGPPAEGSTDLAYSTFITDPVGTRVDIADQEDDAGTMVSTLVTSGCFFTSYTDILRNESITIASFGVADLPGGLDIDAATGDITGTLDSDSDDSSPYSVTVEAIYTSGLVFSCDFTWTVNQAGSTPEEVATACAAPDWAWWDASTNDYVYTTNAATTKTVTEGLVNAFLDRSPHGHDLYTLSDGGDDIWSNVGSNGFGSWIGKSSGAVLTTNNGLNTEAEKLIADGIDAWSFFMITRFHDVASATRAHVAGDGGSGSAATWAFWPANGAATGYRINSNIGGAPERCRLDSALFPSWTATIGTYQHLYIELSTTTCTAYVNNIDVTEAGAEGVWPNSNGCGNFNLGGTTPLGFINDVNFLEVGVFACHLDSASRTAMYEYHKNRYQLPGS